MGGPNHHPFSDSHLLCPNPARSAQRMTLAEGLPPTYRPVSGATNQRLVIAGTLLCQGSQPSLAPSVQDSDVASVQPRWVPSDLPCPGSHYPNLDVNPSPLEYGHDRWARCVNNIIDQSVSSLKKRQLLNGTSTVAACNVSCFSIFFSLVFFRLLAAKYYSVTCCGYFVLFFFLVLFSCLAILTAKFFVVSDGFQLILTNRTLESIKKKDN